MSGHPELVDCLYLVGCGVPFDVAFSLSPAERLAFTVIFGTLAGRRFDWSRLAWEDG